MPEGHSVHRIARQFTKHFVGRICEASSPQGRFVEGAAVLSGREMLRCFAVGKQMFAEFGDDPTAPGADASVWLRVHLGIYGAWDFAGDFTTKLGQTGEYGRGARIEDADAEDSLSSIGAPRRARLRMAEQEKETELDQGWPPEPVGAVRLRLLTEDVVADLRGPTACEVLDAAGVNTVLDRLGPDPLVDELEVGSAASSNVRASVACPSGSCSWISRSSQVSATFIAPRSCSAPDSIPIRRATRCRSTCCTASGMTG